MLCPFVLWVRFDRISVALPFAMLLAVVETTRAALALASAPLPLRTRVCVTIESPSVLSVAR